MWRAYVFRCLDDADVCIFPLIHQTKSQPVDDAEEWWIWASSENSGETEKHKEEVEKK